MSKQAKPLRIRVGVLPFLEANMSDAREQFVRELEAAKAEMKTAGPIHRRDLRKHIREMERELQDYDRFQREAAAKSLKT